MAMPNGLDEGLAAESGSILEQSIDRWLATWGPDGPPGPPCPNAELPTELQDEFLDRARRLVDDHHRLREAFQGVGLIRDERPADSGKAGRFSLLKPLHEGGMGRVYLAWDAEVGRRVAYKVRKDGLPRHLEQQFDREVELTDRVRQPGVVPIYGRVEDDSGRPAYVMEFVEGQTLGEVVNASHPLVPFDELLHQILEACRIVAHAHKVGVVHLDLSLKNLLVGSDGRVRVLDWGLARDLSELENDEASKNTLDPPPWRPGTPAFQGPSGFEGLPPSLASDVHALGRILTRVVESHSDRSAAAQSRALRAILQKATAPAAIDRYPDAGALAGDLARWLAGEPVPVHRESLSERLSRLARHRPEVAALSAGLGLLATVGLVVVGWLLAEARRSDRAAREQARSAELARAEAEANAQLVLRVIRERFLVPSSVNRPLSAGYRELNAVLPHLRKLHRLRPDDREVRANLAWVVGIVGRWERHNGDRARAVALQAESSEIAAALIADRPDDLEARRLALQAIQGLIEIDGSNVYLRDSDWPQRVITACAALEQAVGPSISPEDRRLLIRSRLNAAWAFQESGRAEIARPIVEGVRHTIERELLTTPNDSDLLVALNDTSLVIGDRDVYRDSLRLTLARAPNAEHVRMALVLDLAADLGAAPARSEQARRAALEMLQVGAQALPTLEHWAESSNPYEWLNVADFDRLLVRSAKLLGRDSEVSTFQSALERLLRNFVMRFPDLAPPNHWIILNVLSRSQLDDNPGPPRVSPDEVEAELAELLDVFTAVDPVPGLIRATQLARAHCQAAMYRGVARDDASRIELLGKARALLSSLGSDTRSDPNVLLAWSEYWTLTAKRRLQLGEPPESVLDDRLRAAKAVRLARDLLPSNRFIFGECLDRFRRLTRLQAETARYSDAEATLTWIEELVQFEDEHPRMLAEVYRKTADAIRIYGTGPVPDRQAAERRLLDRARFWAGKFQEPGTF